MVVQDSPVQSEYRSRLLIMEEWYRDFAAEGSREQTLLEDYTPHADFLATLSGRILDVGGGAGLAARFLRPDATYVVLDPLELWQSPEWAGFSRAFRAGGPEPEFIKGCGEDIPFADEEFDSVVSFWSLNHVEDPRRCVSEMIRVLKRGGTGRVVVEDSEPRWSDLLGDASIRIWARFTGRQRRARIPRPLVDALRMKLTGKWLIEKDHFPVSENDLLQWMGDKAVIGLREWLGGYLTFDFARRR